MVKGFQHVDSTERRLVKNMAKAKLTWTKIQEITGRSSSTLSEVLKAPKLAATKPIGRPKLITPRVYRKLCTALKALQKKVKAKKEITVAKVMAQAGVVASERSVLDAFHAHDVWFYKLKERPVLEPEDVVDRLQWAEDHKARTKTGWEKKPHAIIDNKRFQVYTNHAGREYAARRSVRGAYQERGSKPPTYLVRPKDTLKFPATGVTVTAAVIDGKIRMWEYVKGNWNATTAAKMYEGPLLKAMRRAFPEHAAKPRARWVVLEDNDPSGYKSRKALTAKADSGIITDDLPRRSPDLNVLDYALWHEINVRMRKQEAAFGHRKKESKKAYLKRLRKTALSLPSATVKEAVRGMRRRVEDLVKAKGGLIE